MIVFIVAEILANEDLLSIEQIEAFILPHTLLYMVTVPSALRRSTIVANITLSSLVNGKYRVEQTSRRLT